MRSPRTPDVATVFIRIVGNAQPLTDALGLCAMTWDRARSQDASVPGDTARLVIASCITSDGRRRARPGVPSPRRTSGTLRVPTAVLLGRSSTTPRIREAVCARCITAAGGATRTLAQSSGRHRCVRPMVCALITCRMAPSATGPTLQAASAPFITRVFRMVATRMMREKASECRSTMPSARWKPPVRHL